MPAVATAPMVQANNDFAFALLHQLIEERPRANQFISPFSIESALMIALEGARGLTASQIGRTLRLPANLQQQDGTWDMATVRAEYSDLVCELEPPCDPESIKRRKELAALQKEYQVSCRQFGRKLAEHSQDVEDCYTRVKSLTEKIRAIAQTTHQYALTTASSLWVDQRYPLARAFQSIVTNYYGSAEAQSCDFQQNASVETARINSWIAQRTQNKIQKLLSEGAIGSDTRLVIANAIYFKGNWEKPFEQKRTCSAEFNAADGDKLQIELMYSPSHKSARYAAFDRSDRKFKTPKTLRSDANESKAYPSSDGFEVLELPYAGDRMTMVIVLPRAADGIDSLVSSLKADRLQTFRAELVERTVHIKLPKFKMDTSYDLLPSLSKLGMQEAFSSTRANLTGLLENESPSDRLYISNIIHTATIDVTEEGTEATAATAGLKALFCDPEPFVPKFTADRPFLVAIVDKQTDMILFLGKVEAPQSN